MYRMSDSQCSVSRGEFQRLVSSLQDGPPDLQSIGPGLTFGKDNLPPSAVLRKWLLKSNPPIWCSKGASTRDDENPAGEY